MPTSLCHSLHPDDILIKGDLYTRARANFDRLEQQDYRSAQLFQPLDHDWPGDTEGRTLLALVLLARWAHLELHTLGDLLHELPARMNSEGCFGPPQKPGQVDEQQLSGHTWILRFLVEHYRWKQLPETRAMIERIVDTLVIPASAHFVTYPSAASSRARSDSDNLTGVRTETIGAWTLSSDIGAAFAILDGATQAYELLGQPSRLKSALDLIVAAYTAIDPVALGASTHAMLTALRGLVRFHALHASPVLLSHVQHTYATYMATARTENYAAHARFGHPIATDPCAIVDSFVLAIDLWRCTFDPAYLDDAHHIYYNAFLPSQRPSGGFGRDSCTGYPTTQLHLTPLEDPYYESVRCCTPRGGEGLAAAAASVYHVDPQADTVFVNLYQCSTATLRFADGHLVIRQTTTYPVDGWIRLDLLDSTVKTPKTFQLFLPEWASPADLPTSTVHGRFVEAVFSTNHTILVRFDIPWHRVAVLGSDPPVPLATPVRIDTRVATSRGTSPVPPAPSPCTLRHGPLLLGASRAAAERGKPGVELVKLTAEARLVPLGQASYLIDKTMIGLSPLVDLVRPLDTLERGNRKQVVFPGDD
ncbi:hypothetical protein BC936DRAFT_136611 [Jimgerdemannia flammicorona]|uniref:Uncharacterized protein n=2 Tax=Jimgerdemannia flammicorona TaxID=994334 RepID=A0A433Q7D4_9FUNG|nr:hypothetical protein BC936DRAFT_136611 [Jimgerdemannia flammicorona]RUS25685.1 hypothetical protein BC938DRAFT_471794 [Jimgerdemannia flammicorona]